jgi:hypothetical protein
MSGKKRTIEKRLVGKYSSQLVLVPLLLELLVLFSFSAVAL